MKKIIIKNGKNGKNGRFIDIPTKFVPPHQSMMRLIHVKDNEIFYYSNNPFGHKKSFLCPNEYGLKNGYYEISKMDFYVLRGLSDVYVLKVAEVTKHCGTLEEMEKEKCKWIDATIEKHQSIIAKK